MMKKDYNKTAVSVFSTVAIGFIMTIWAQSGLSQDAAVPQDAWAKYQIILQRNIFSRQRGPLRQRQQNERSVRAIAPNPESYFLLKGIVQENGTFFAFLEDTRGGDILRVRNGDSVARGVIKVLCLDSIEYQFEERTITVNIGHDLQGGRGAVTMTELYEWSQTSSTTPQEDATQPSSPSGDEAEILRQLMKRRQQQLGR